MARHKTVKQDEQVYQLKKEQGFTYKEIQETEFDYARSTLIRMINRHQDVINNK